MSRGQTKANVILKAAMARVTEWQERRDKLRAEEKTAQVIYEAHLDMYKNLERELAPKSRSNGAAKSPKKEKSKIAELPSIADAICGACGEKGNHWSHDIAGYASAHPFVSSSSAPSAKKKSSRFKDSQTAHAQSLETGEAAVSLVDDNAIGHSA